MFYAALDVSLRSVAICIIDEAGKVRLERSVPSDVPDLVRCLNEFGEPISVGVVPAVFDVFRIGKLEADVEVAYSSRGRVPTVGTDIQTMRGT